MSGGKHASRSKSFEDLEFNRKERGRRNRKRETFEENDDNNFDIHNNTLNYSEDNEEDENNYYDDNNENDGNDDNDEYWEDEPEINYKKIIIVAIVIIVVLAAIFGIYKIVSSKNEKNEALQDEISQANNEEMPVSISGYKVLGQVIIKDLDIEQYILNLPEDEALKNGVAKLYGSSLNSNGNFCIAGHNYEGVFKDLEKLNVGDKIIIKDTKNVEYEYKVTSVKNVEPDNLECLMQDTSKVEITLITCDTGGTSRVVVKAEQVAKDNG